MMLSAWTGLPTLASSTKRPLLRSFSLFTCCEWAVVSDTAPEGRGTVSDMALDS